MKNKLPQSFKIIWESFFILSLILSLMLLMGLVAYAHTGAGGKVGRLLSSAFFYLFGYIAYLLPVIFSYIAWFLFRSRTQQEHESPEALWKTAGFLMSLIAICSLASISVNHTGGGIIGEASALSLITAFSSTGAIIFSLGLLLCGITLLTGFSWLAFSDQLGGVVLKIFKKIPAVLNSLKNQPVQAIQQKISPKAPAPVISPVVLASEEMPAMPVYAPMSVDRLPLVLSDLLVLLDIPVIQSEKTYSAEALQTMSREVENKLKDFGITVQVVAAHPGPVVTRFEMQLAPGIKASRITTLAKDLARSLSMMSVRVVEIIPGKAFVGLELPNQHRETVRLREVLSAPVYQEARSPLSLALGKDIAGHPVVVDLAKMPHLLVAGTTGSGKSVGLNAMLLSFLFKASSKEMRMIMIDPKMLELSIYEGIPHLLTPVVTDMKEAANALRWCVGEMERRYRLMAALGVRNLAGFNLKIQEAMEKGEALIDPLWRAQASNSGDSPTALTTLPYIVVIIDEFADMIMVVGKKVEELIARIAQKARAAGIHLILATQRPSVDVITGLIKANIPTRIAFQVSSKIDSRTILDQQGAEQLLGHGDMLYLAPGTGVPVRVHGAFVADHEVHKVVEFLKSQGAPEYLENVLTEQSNCPSGLFSDDNADNPSADFSDESDPLYDQAVHIVLETRKASISSVQRRLRIGYNRAARLLETMENAGLVSAFTAGGTREVLVPKKMD